MVEMEVVGVALEPNSNRPLVWLKDDDQRWFLPIAIGNFEATAIYMELHDDPPARPITHDLLRSILQGLDAQISRVVINELRDDTFHAEIELAAGDRTVSVDSRPSDAIALALRTGSAIYVSDQVVRDAALDVEDSEGEAPDLQQIASMREDASGEPVGDVSTSSDGVERGPPEQRVTTLRSRLRAAVNREEYEEAARLRDEIGRLENRVS